MKRALAFTLMVLAIMIIAVSCDEPHVHSFAPEWSYDDTYHWYASTCGHEEVSEKGEHVWKEGGDDNGWITEKEATETEKGSAYRICTVCGYKGTKDIQKLSHVHTYSSYSSNSDKHWRTCTDCGETFTYTHTFSTYVDGGEKGHYPKCNCGYKKTTIEDHVYTGTQKVSETTSSVCNVCDKCGYQDPVKKAETNTEVATAGATASVENKPYEISKVGTQTVKVIKEDVSIAVASSAVSSLVSANEESEEVKKTATTTVTFPKGALKVEDGAKSVSLIVTAAPAAVASNDEYKKETSAIGSNKVVVAGFEFTLEGAVASDLAVKDTSGKVTSGATITTYIAKNLCANITNETADNAKGLEITYLGTDTDNEKAVINEYVASSGKLVFTVYHFSKYAITSNVAVATDNKGTVYSVDSSTSSEAGYATAFDALKTALGKIGSDGITTITLMKDVELTESITMTASGTLNLNGKTITPGNYKISVATDNNKTVYSLTISGSKSGDKTAFVKDVVKIGDSSTIDGTYYNTLEGALSSVSDNDTVSLLGTATLNGDVEVKENITLDLKEKIVTVDQKRNVSVTEGKVVTIKNAADNQDILVTSGVKIGDATKADGKYYSTLPDAVASVGSDETVSLLADVSLSETLKIENGKAFTLDLNKKTITNLTIWEGANSTSNPYLIYVSGANTNLTITGEGKVFANSTNLNKNPYEGGALEDARMFAMEVYNSAAVTIKNSEFIGSGDCIYVHTGKVNIEGGTFSLQSDWDSEGYKGKFLLNCKNGNWTATPRTANIEVTGGTFVNFNPASGNGGAGAENTFVKVGYKVTSETGTDTNTNYTVSECTEHTYKDWNYDKTTNMSTRKCSACENIEETNELIQIEWVDAMMGGKRNETDYATADAVGKNSYIDSNGVFHGTLKQLDDSKFTAFWGDERTTKSYYVCYDLKIDNLTSSKTATEGTFLVYVKTHTENGKTVTKYGKETDRHWCSVLGTTAEEAKSYTIKYYIVTGNYAAIGNSIVVEGNGATPEGYEALIQNGTLVGTLSIDKDVTFEPINN